MRAASYVREGRTGVRIYQLSTSALRLDQNNVLRIYLRGCDKHNVTEELPAWIGDGVTKCIFISRMDATNNRDAPVAREKKSQWGVFTTFRRIWYSLVRTYKPKTAYAALATKETAAKPTGLIKNKAAPANESDVAEKVLTCLWFYGAASV
jgi:hypothetical protein